MASLSDSEKTQIMLTDLYKHMPVYPATGSIQKIDDVWVVKLCENEDY